MDASVSGKTLIVGLIPWLLPWWQTGNDQGNNQVYYNWAGYIFLSQLKKHIVCDTLLHMNTMVVF